MLPDIKVRATANVGDAVEGLDRLGDAYEKAGRRSDHASDRVRKAGDNIRAGSRRLSAAVSANRNFSRSVQNVSFQLGDFATQVGAGTAASIALGQQLPQLLGGFGALGAVLGAVVAIGVPMARVLKGMSDNGQELSTVLGTLQPLAAQLSEAFAFVAETGRQMAEILLNNLDRVLITGGVVAAFFAGKWAVSFAAARIATMSLAGVLTTLRGALIRTGFGAIVVAAGELVYQFSRLVRAAGGFGEAFKLVQQVASEAFQNIDILSQALWDGLKATALAIAAEFIEAFGSIQRAFASLANTILSSPLLEAFGLDVGQMAENAINGIGGIDDKVKELRDSASGLFASSAGGFKNALPSLTKIKDLLKSMKDENLSLDDILKGGSGDEDGGGGSKDKRDRSGIDQLMQTLQTQREQLQAWYAEQKEILAKMNEEELELLGGHNEAKLRLEEEYQRRLSEIRQREANDRIQSIQNWTGAISSILSSFGNMMDAENKKQFEKQKKIRKAAAIVEGIGAAVAAWRKGMEDGGPWLAAAYTAASVAKTAAQIAAIDRQSFNGGGGQAATGSATPTAPQTSNKTVYDLTMQGEMFGREQVLQLINKINEAQEGGAVVRVV